MTTYSVFEAKNSLSKLIAASSRGEEVIVSNRGTPVARIIPFSNEPRELTGAELAAKLSAKPIPSRLQRSPESLDAQIAESRDSWA